MKTCTECGREYDPQTFFGCQQQKCPTNYKMQSLPDYFVDDPVELIDRRKISEQFPKAA